MALHSQVGNSNYRRPEYHNKYIVDQQNIGEIPCIEDTEIFNIKPFIGAIAVLPEEAM